MSWWYLHITWAATVPLLARVRRFSSEVLEAELWRDSSVQFVTCDWSQRMHICTPRHEWKIASTNCHVSRRSLGGCVAELSEAARACCINCAVASNSCDTSRVHGENNARSIVLGMLLCQLVHQRLEPHFRHTSPFHRKTPAAAASF